MAAVVWKRMWSSRSAWMQGEERAPAGQHLLPLSWSVVTFRRRRTRSSSVSPLSVSRDFRLRELVDLFSVSYSKRKAWEALWGQMMPSSSCTQLQNLSHCSSRAAWQALPLEPQQQLGSTPHPDLGSCCRDKPHSLHIRGVVSGWGEMPWPCHWWTNPDVCGKLPTSSILTCEGS